MKALSVSDDSNTTTISVSQNPLSELDRVLKPVNTPADIAKRTGIAEGTLGYWRSSGIGPKFSKIGKTVLYAKEDILNYLRENRFQSTQETKKAPAATGAK